MHVGPKSNGVVAPFIYEQTLQHKSRRNVKPTTVIFATNKPFSADSMNEKRLKILNSYSIRMDNNLKIIVLALGVFTSIMIYETCFKNKFSFLSKFIKTFLN